MSNDFFSSLFGGLFSPQVETNPAGEAAFNLFSADPFRKDDWLLRAFPTETPPWAPWHPDYESSSLVDREAATELFNKRYALEPTQAPPITPNPPPVPTKNPYGLNIDDYMDQDSVWGGVTPSGLDDEDMMYRAKMANAPDLSKLPVAGDVRFPLAGKSIADVPSHGTSPFSRDFGGHVRGGRGHAGLDIPGKIGEPYLAHTSGTILAVGNDRKGYGHFVDVLMDDGTVHRVAHLGDLDKGGSQVPFPKGITRGARVSPGQIIGYVGASGNAGREFSHAHVEIFASADKYKAAQGKASTAGINYRTDPRAYWAKLANLPVATAAKTAMAPDTFKRGRSGLGVPMPKENLDTGNPNGARAVTIKARPTAYAPVVSGTSDADPVMEDGGWANKSAWRGPDGKNIVRTLAHVAQGESDYVTLAGAKQFRGKTYIIPELPFMKPDGEVVVLQNVKAVVHDTGGAFKKAPEGRFDIAVGYDVSNKIQAKNNDLWLKWKGKGIEFIRQE